MHGCFTFLSEKKRRGQEEKIKRKEKKKEKMKRREEKESRVDQQTVGVRGGEKWGEEDESKPADQETR